MNEKKMDNQTAHAEAKKQLSLHKKKHVTKNHAQKNVTANVSKNATSNVTKNVTQAAQKNANDTVNANRTANTSAQKNVSEANVSSKLYLNGTVISTKVPKEEENLAKELLKEADEDQAQLAKSTNGTASLTQKHKKHHKKAKK